MVIYIMNNNIMYRIFLFLSTFTRGLVEVFSLVLLYKKGYSIEMISLFLFLMYFIGIFINYISLKFSYKFILFLSNILYVISFIYLSFMGNSFIELIILAGVLASGTYSYHAIRHLLGLKMVSDKVSNTTLVITFMYLGIIASSIVGSYILSKVSFFINSIIIFILSIISIIPIFKMDIGIEKTNKKTKVIIDKDKILFNIFEQFKIIFLELQPLFLYMYIDKSIYYVGIFNVIVNLASLIVVYFLSRRVSVKYFKYICILLSIVFILKLNINSGIILLIIAFFEGIFVKLYETFSLNNLYSLDGNSIYEYLRVEELIFFGSKSIIMLLVCIFKLDIYIVMYICIVGIIISGMFIKNRKINN